MIRALLCVLAAPWFALWALWRSARKASRFVRAVKTDVVHCADGHTNDIVGRWACKCGYEFVGRAFAACGNCGQAAGWIECERCSLGIPDPGR